MQDLKTDNCWYVLIVSYNRVQRMQKHLQNNDIKCFVPMRYKYVIRQGQKKRMEVPAIHNLLFVHSNQKVLEPHLQEYSSTIRYMFHKGTKSPIVIPWDEMNRFMLIAGTHRDDLIYLNDGIDKFSKHDKVRVTGGYFENFEGYVVRIRRDKKLVVSIQGVVAVAISNIHPSLLMKIDN